MLFLKGRLKQPEFTLAKFNNDVYGDVMSFLMDSDLFCLMLTAKKFHELAQIAVYVKYYESLICKWNQLLSSDIEPSQRRMLKTLAVEMYQRGLITKIIGDLTKVNLRSVIIPALLDGYEFNPQDHASLDHASLDLASHLLFFNKSADILFAQDGNHYDRFPSSHEMENVLTRYAQQTKRDSFYLIFTSSAQVIYYNKLTRAAKVFICQHAGWGIYGYPNDHIFSVLLYRTIGHVDCLVDVPEQGLDEGIDLSDDSVLSKAINDGSLFLAFYRSYREAKVDCSEEERSFEHTSGYCGHYYKTNPASLNGRSRNGRREQFIDYLMEELFPIRDNYIYNNRSEDRTPIVLVESRYLEQLAVGPVNPKPIRADYFRVLGKGFTMFAHQPTQGEAVLDSIGFLANPVGVERNCLDNLDSRPFSISRVIAHQYYSKAYVVINTREQLVHYLLHSEELSDVRLPSTRLSYIDYGETILERLDYGYLCNLLRTDNASTWDDVRVWLEREYGEDGNYAALEQNVREIFDKGIRLLAPIEVPIEPVRQQAVERSWSWPCVVC